MEEGCFAWKSWNLKNPIYKFIQNPLSMNLNGLRTKIGLKARIQLKICNLKFILNSKYNYEGKYIQSRTLNHIETLF